MTKWICGIAVLVVVGVVFGVVGASAINSDQGQLAVQVAKKNIKSVATAKAEKKAKAEKEMLAVANQYNNLCWSYQMATPSAYGAHPAASKQGKRDLRKKFCELARAYEDEYSRKDLNSFLKKNRLESFSKMD